MALDFITLYVVVLLNSILISVVWAVIYKAYDRFDAAGIWMLASVALVLGGLSLASEAYFLTLVPIYIGNLLIVAGFCLYWAGIRRFQGRPIPWLAMLALIAVMAAILPWFTFVEPHYNIRNIIYAVAQSTPLAFSIADLRREPQRRPGMRLAAAGMALAIFVHGVETAGNLLQMGGLISREAYGVIEPAVILMVIFSGTLWNFGLVLMVIDHLYGALQRLAQHDELTGLANRRAAVERLAGEIRIAGTAGTSLSILIIDLDGFKTINDTFGHLAGDACLVQVARTAEARLRAGDLIARTGGDELLVILPGARLEGAAAIAAVLVAAIRNAPVEWERGAIPMTLSIGVAEWRLGQTGDELIAVADAALYEAKAKGRDRHAVAGETLEAAFAEALADDAPSKHGKLHTLPTR